MFYTKSPAVARIADRINCQWPLRSYKVNEFCVIWKSVCHFLLVINSNFTFIFYRFRDTATYYSLHLSIKNCGQTAADGDTVTIDNL